uniref:Uncharacterized protein n=1 Tax=Accipiter nisus TaxID=211598 RepID=A0A8B9S019_9AVES
GFLSLRSFIPIKKNCYIFHSVGNYDLILFYLLIIYFNFTLLGYFCLASTCFNFTTIREVTVIWSYL